MIATTRTRKLTLGTALTGALAMVSACNVDQKLGPTKASVSPPSAASHSGGAALAQAGPAVLTFQKLPEQTAEAINARMPISSDPLVPARPFRLAADIGGSNADLTAATDCLTAAIYYEAASEPDSGKAAVGQVVLNRLRHPAFPKTVCGVVFQGMERSTGCQFTFACDGSLARVPLPAAWLTARRIAREALSGHVERAVGLATHYHTRWVVPYWRSDLVKAAVVGAHIFYRWTGGWGQIAAFRGRYAGAETVPQIWLGQRASILLTAATPQSPNTPALSGAMLADDVSKRSSAADATEPLAPRLALAADQQRPMLLADERKGTLLTD